MERSYVTALACVGDLTARSLGVTACGSCLLHALIYSLYYYSVNSHSITQQSHNQNILVVFCATRNTGSSFPARVKSNPLASVTAGCLEPLLRILRRVLRGGGARRGRLRVGRRANEQAPACAGGLVLPLPPEAQGLLKHEDLGAPRATDGGNKNGSRTAISAHE